MCGALDHGWRCPVCLECVRQKSCSGLDPRGYRFYVRTRANLSNRKHFLNANQIPLRLNTLYCVPSINEIADVVRNDIEDSNINPNLALPEWLNTAEPMRPYFEVSPRVVLIHRPHTCPRSFFFSLYEAPYVQLAARTILFQRSARIRNISDTERRGIPVRNRRRPISGAADHRPSRLPAHRNQTPPCRVCRDARCSVV